MAIVSVMLAVAFFIWLVEHKREKKAMRPRVRRPE